MNADKSDATIGMSSDTANAAILPDARNEVQSPMPAHDDRCLQGTTGAVQNFRQYAVIMALFVSCRPPL